MTPGDTRLNDDHCYLALKAQDARFDGRFFTGVTSTGIYCRPVCRVRTPKRENCRFFSHAAQAESAGFRPCLRCRPELAPHSVVWSIQDASYILAHQAARLLDEPEAWTPTLVASRTALPPEGAAFARGGPSLRPLTPTLVASRTALPPEGAAFARGGPSLHATISIKTLAEKLGVSDRHVRRIFEAQFGVSPLQYLQTRRLLTAKQLLADTDLPITQIALASGYASVRRFNAAFLSHYQLNPTQLRRAGSTAAGQGTTVRLGYRPPYDVAALLDFWQKRRLDAIEFIADGTEHTRVGRTFGVETAGKRHTGWLVTQFDTTRCQLVLQVSDSLREVLPLVIRRVRAAYDLDADPQAIAQVLGACFPHSEGQRVPGGLDGFELAVRAVLGQQITVAAARTLAQRLVNTFGEPLATPWPELTRLFPTPAVLAAASGDALGQLGIVKQRQAAIVALARAVGAGLQLHGGVDVQGTVAALKALPGIGDWTAQYIAMRALRWPDAFPAGDVALQKALFSGRGETAPQNPAKKAKEAEQLSSAWKPWRSYAVIRAWSGGLVAAPGADEVTDSLPGAIKLIATRARVDSAKPLKHLKKTLPTPLPEGHGAQNRQRHFGSPPGDSHEI